jgi:hypothetical protein
MGFSSLRRSSLMRTSYLLLETTENQPSTVGIVFSPEQLVQMQQLIQQTLAASGTAPTDPLLKTGPTPPKVNNLVRPRDHWSQDSEEDDEEDSGYEPTEKASNAQLDAIFQPQSALSQTSLQLLERAAKISNIATLAKLFTPGQPLAELETPLLTAFQRDDELDFPSGSGAVYSVPTDNKLQEANQMFLDALKPWLLTLQDAERLGLDVAELHKTFAASAAMIFRGSYLMNRLRTQLILRQAFPHVCKNTKPDVLAKKLSGDVEFKTDQVASLSGGQFATKLVKQRKVLEATREFADTSNRSAGAGPSGAWPNQNSNAGARQNNDSRWGRQVNQLGRGRNLFNNIRATPFNTGEILTTIFLEKFSRFEGAWQHLPLGGRTALAKEAWLVITNEEWTLQTICGARLQFLRLTDRDTSFFCSDRLFPETQSNAILLEIHSLLDRKAIRRTRLTDLSFLCPLFLISRENKKVRLIHNLKPLNACLTKLHFKMEGLPAILQVIQEGDYFIKIDLKDAYLSIPMHPKEFPFLGFSCNNEFFNWTSLPFGLSQAPWIFTKILKPVAAYLRKLGIRLSIYLDDFLVMNKVPELLFVQGQFTVKLLKCLGFEISDKSILIPSRRIIFLGFVLDSELMKVFVPEEKLDKFICEIKLILTGGRCSLQILSGLIGKMNSFCQAILPGHLHFRNVDRFLHEQLRQYESDYSQVVILSKEVLESLNWWHSCFKRFNGKPFQPPAPSIRITTDSSLFRWGAVCGSETISYAWDSTDSSHINIKELRAVLLAFRSFIKRPLKQLTTVGLWMDNCCAVHAINKFGSSSCTTLNDLACELWHLAIDFNCFLQAFYIPGKENIEADWASRYFIDCSDWQLDRNVFSQLDARYGPLILDLFASHQNSQLPEFYSWLPDPYAKAVDAFSQEWPPIGAYAFPPFNCISRLLEYVRKRKISLILIAPAWPQQVWYPSLLALLRDYPRSLPENQDLLRNPAGQGHPMMINNSLHLTVWPLSGLTCHHQLFRNQLPSSSQLLSASPRNVHTGLVGNDGWLGAVGTV